MIDPRTPFLRAEREMEQRKEQREQMIVMAKSLAQLQVKYRERPQNASAVPSAFFGRSNRFQAANTIKDNSSGQEHQSISRVQSRQK